MVRLGYLKEEVSHNANFDCVFFPPTIVDFGYILNRDPKPFPPPVKVSKEMVDCMGGPSSPNYARFRQLCFTAFSILRKNSSLILNLIGLMTDANVGDIKVEPDRAVPKVGSTAGRIRSPHKR